MRKYSLQIELLFALLIILLFAVYGCGTRHAEIIKKDSIHIKNSYSTGSKIILGNTFTYKPFDALKPMIIDKKEYVNVIISNDKNVIIEKWKNRNITKTITLERTKATIRENNDFLYLGIILIVVIGILAWFKLPSFRKGNHF